MTSGVGILVRVPLALLLYGLLIIWPPKVVAETRSYKSARDRFLKEAPEKWLEYRKIMVRQSKGTYNWTVYATIPHEKEIAHYRGSFVLNLEQGCAQNVVDEEKGPKERKLIKKQTGEVFNGDYAFGIKGSQEGDWILNYLNRSPPNIPHDLIGRNGTHPVIMGEQTLFGSSISQACLGQKLFGAWLPRMVESRLFKVVQAEYLDPEQHLVKVEYEFQPDFKTGGAAPARSGTLVLDANRYWLISEAKTQAEYYEGQGTLEITNTFNDKDFALPFVSRQVMWVSCPKPNQREPFKHRWIKEVNLHDAGNVDSEMFTLSAFGLSEPTFAAGPSLTRLLGMGLSVALLAIAIILLYRRRGHAV